MDTTNITRDQAIDTLLVDHFKGDEQALITHLYRRSKRASTPAHTTFTPYYETNEMLYQIDNLSDEEVITEEQSQAIEDFIMANPVAAADYYTSQIENNDELSEIESEAAREAVKGLLATIESE